MLNKQKIFVISLHRSLTRSTDALISMLGYNTLHFPKFFQGQNVMEKIRGRENSPDHILEVLRPIIDSQDSVSDVPIPTLYRHLEKNGLKAFSYSSTGTRKLGPVALGLL